MLAGLRRGKLRWIVWSGLAALALVASCRALEVSTVGRPAHPMTADRLRAEVAGDLPAGTGLAEVLGWLDRRGLAPVRPIPGGAGPVREFVVLIDDTSRSFVIRADLVLRFRFDDAGRLTGFEVEERLTGL